MNVYTVVHVQCTVYSTVQYSTHRDIIDDLIKDHYGTVLLTYCIVRLFKAEPVLRVLRVLYTQCTVQYVRT